MYNLKKYKVKNKNVCKTFDKDFQAFRDLIVYGGNQEKQSCRWKRTYMCLSFNPCTLLYV